MDKFFHSYSLIFDTCDSKGIVFNNKVFVKYKDLVGILTVERKMLFSTVIETVCVYRDGEKVKSLKLDISLDKMIMIPHDMVNEGFYHYNDVIATYSIERYSKFNFSLRPQLFLASEARFVSPTLRVSLLDKQYNTDAINVHGHEIGIMYTDIILSQYRNFSLQDIFIKK